MSGASRSVVVVAAVSLVAGLLAAPGAAYAADTTTPLSQAEMTAALAAVAATSTAAAKDGWRATMTATGDKPHSMLHVVDSQRGMVMEQMRSEEYRFARYAVARKGTYRNLGDADERAALTMMRRPTVRYVFTPDASLTLDGYLNDSYLPTPATVTAEQSLAGTRTVHDDGSTDYTSTDDNGMTVTLQVSAVGRLTGARATGGGMLARMTYGYGPQRVTVPTGPFISPAELNKGLMYLHMADTVEGVANQGASETRRAARGRTVKVASLRAIVRRTAAGYNSSISLKMMFATDIRGGVRVSATNPWTRRTVAYTVTVSGAKVTVTG